MRSPRRRRLALAFLLVTGSARASEQNYRLEPAAARRPSEVVVHPGDRIQVRAEGCLAIPGRVPQPLLQADPNQEQALIFIPGVTMTFAPVAGLVGREVSVPRTLDYPTEPRVWLDWGRSFASPLQAPDGGPRPAATCADAERQTPARIDLRVTSGEPAYPAPAGTLTLEYPRYDLNLLPLNPSWAGGVQPDICSTCDGFRVVRDAGGTWRVPALHDEKCTLQKPYLDSGGCRPRAGDCPRGGKHLFGHVNWGPATFTGLLSTLRGGPVHLALDGDTNFFLEPDGGAGLLAQKPKSVYRGVIGLEFSSAETNRWFRTDWWRNFPFRAHEYEPMSAFWMPARRHPDSTGPFPSVVRRPATVIGIFGIDTVHGAHPESHPVLALAVQTEARPDREVWQIMARNWGTGGDCSGRLDSRIASRRIALTLRGTSAKSYGGARGVFFDHGLPFANWKLYAGGSGPATLVLELPADRPCSVVEGTLTLRVGSPEPEDAHLSRADVPAGEPIRLNLQPGKRQQCVEEPWFVPVP